CAEPAIHLAAAVAFGSDCERRRGRWFCGGRDRERTVGGVGAWFGDGRRPTDRDKASERDCDWGERGRWGRSAAAGLDRIGGTMITPPPGTRVWLAGGFTDMRKGFDGLAMLVQEKLRRDAFGGQVFVFRGRRGYLLKALWWDGQGLCLFAKRLEKGRFVWPSPTDGSVVLTPAQLGMLLEGIDWRMPGRTWRPDVAGLARLIDSGSRGDVSESHVVVTLPAWLSIAPNFPPISMRCIGLSWRRPPKQKREKRSSRRPRPGSWRRRWRSRSTSFRSPGSSACSSAA